MTLYVFADIYVHIRLDTENNSVIFTDMYLFTLR